MKAVVGVRRRDERRLWSGGTGRVILAVFEPVLQGKLGDGLVGVVGDLAQHVLEGVVGGIDAQTAAGLDDGEEDGAASATLQGAPNSPALLRSRARAQMNFAVGDLPRRVSSVSWVRSDCVRVTLHCKRHMQHPLP